MSLLKSIPKVDRILQLDTIRGLLDSRPRPVVLAAIRAVLAEMRQAALEGNVAPEELTEQTVARRVVQTCEDLCAASLRRVINGTGVVIHTNLGRSLLTDAAKEQLLESAFSYTNLELDLATGERGSRYSHVEGLLCELTGAEAALVVNNNAAAVLLALASLASGREVVVSRGELVEIGGSFRIPEVMAQSGALLREVGTTNRTHIRDYREALSQETGLLLKVHPSNFAVMGFVAAVETDELVAVGREVGIPMMADLGSGSLVDLSPLLGCHEPTVQELVRAGVDIITFSGDKLLGGPQAGIIVGKRQWLAPLRRHPLLRALRIDKLTLAALEATLRIYRDERRALSEIPTLRLLTASTADLSRRGRRLLSRLRRVLPHEVKVALQEGHSQVGGGALPLLHLPTVLISVEAEGMSPGDVEKALRGSPIPVLGRIHKGKFLLDLRTILDNDLSSLAAGLAALAKKKL